MTYALEEFVRAHITYASDDSHINRNGTMPETDPVIEIAPDGTRVTTHTHNPRSTESNPLSLADMPQKNANTYLSTAERYTLLVATRNARSEFTYSDLHRQTNSVLEAVGEPTISYQKCKKLIKQWFKISPTDQPSTSNTQMTRQSRSQSTETEQTETEPEPEPHSESQSDSGGKSEDQSQGGAITGAIEPADSKLAEFTPKKQAILLYHAWIQSDSDENQTMRRLAQLTDVSRSYPSKVLRDHEELAATLTSDVIDRGLEQVILTELSLRDLLRLADENLLDELIANGCEQVTNVEEIIDRKNTQIQQPTRTTSSTQTSATGTSSTEKTGQSETTTSQNTDSTSSDPTAPSGSQTAEEPPQQGSDTQQPVEDQPITGAGANPMQAAPDTQAGLTDEESPPPSENNQTHSQDSSQTRGQETTDTESTDAESTDAKSSADSAPSTEANPEPSAESSQAQSTPTPSHTGPETQSTSPTENRPQGGSPTRENVHDEQPPDEQSQESSESTTTATGTETNSTTGSEPEPEPETETETETGARSPENTQQTESRTQSTEQQAHSGPDTTQRPGGQQKQASTDSKGTSAGQQQQSTNQQQQARIPVEDSQQNESEDTHAQPAQMGTPVQSDDQVQNGEVNTNADYKQGIAELHQLVNFVQMQQEMLEQESTQTGTTPHQARHAALLSQIEQQLLQIRERLADLDSE